MNEALLTNIVNTSPQLAILVVFSGVALKLFEKLTQRYMESIKEEREEYIKSIDRINESTGKFQVLVLTTLQESQKTLGANTEALNRAVSVLNKFPPLFEDMQREHRNTVEKLIALTKTMERRS